MPSTYFMAELRNTTFCTYNIKGYDGVAADTIKDLMPTYSFYYCKKHGNMNRNLLTNLNEILKITLMIAYQ